MCAERKQKECSNKTCAKKTREAFLEHLLRFWDESLPQYSEIKYGFSPDWGSLDIDWDSSIDGITTFGRPNFVWYWIVRTFGLETKLLNYMFGLNLRSTKGVEGVDAIKSILIASILDALEEKLKD